MIENMSDSRYSLLNDVKAGQPIYLDADDNIVILKPEQWFIAPIGLAKRDIAKGEVVEYRHNADTKDIAVFKLR